MKRIFLNKQKVATKSLVRIGLGALKTIGWLIAILWAFYLFGAFYFDMKLGMPAGVASAIFAVVMVSIVIFIKGQRRALFFVGSCAVITSLWSTKRPSNNRDWVEDKAVLAYAEFNGDQVTIHNVRDAIYRDILVVEPQYISRTIDLSKVVGLDLFNCFWGSDIIAHPMISWRFENDKAITISIETRNVKNTKYSVVSGLYRQYEQIYTVCTDRDAVLRRSIYEPDGDQVYMYMIDISPVDARALLEDYLRRLNELYHKPVWYNLFLNNCTTAIRIHTTATQDFPMPWNWGILFPGLYCKSIYDNDGMVSSLDYEELAERGLRNEVANKIGRADDFWIQIRKDVPGFENYFNNTTENSNHDENRNH